MPDRIDWKQEALQQQLAALLPGLTVEVVRQTHSTNSALLERARGATPAAGVGPGGGDGDPNVIVRRSVESTAFGRRSIDLQPCLLVAEHQTAGRGRQGRSWQSEPGASLTFSLALAISAAPSVGASWGVSSGASSGASSVLSPPHHAGDLSGLSLAVGVAIADALDGPQAPPGASRIALKWPNDLWLVGATGQGRKLGGVLIETLAAGAQRLVVVGVGLNVRHFDAQAVTTGFATLDEREPTLTAPEVLARIALPLVQALERFEADGFAAFAERFNALDMLRGRAVSTTSPEAAQGTASGVSREGALLVRTATGGLVPIVSGEVSVRLAAPAA